ncbi:hypothetical protein EII29_07830 [Leptotrichia sp. OH3620_COT-345]|uniref:restriction endonuclease subunit S n=1 Tax=Leptotrichia sp. OH3620_COT-345 TaxID=2491048 RepID=UPI000F650395|nr:restriction endonuclease subunit S [Leptotrichia sp. OH3620_COT-345]RRD39304.1 hypothetical protein EII29_07830 [Leptotrichia sp. OH3620_COT-345]
MSKIMDMIKNEKVEWKKLGEVCDIVKGKQFNKRDMLEDGKYPVINGGITPSGYVEVYNQSANTITISQGGASAGFINFIENKFWLGAHAFAINPKDTVLNRYIYHFLKMNQEKLQDKKEGAGIPSISKTTLESLEIPIPSIETQEKIVKILDKFTNYVTELQAELQARTKQYSYYRDMLLSEENLNKLSKKLDRLEDKKYELRIVTLGEIVDIMVGGDVPKNNFSKTKTKEFSIPIYSNGIAEKALYGYTNQIRVDKPSVTVSARGTIGYVCLREEPYYPIVRLLCLLPKQDIAIKYLYYFLQNSKINHIHTGIPSLTTDMVKNIKLYLPPILIQNKVVEILDKFQSLLSDTQGLLPQEIEQRQKQYEFYREKLLTFDEKYGSLPACLPACLIIDTKFFSILKEAAAIVEVELFNKVEWKTLGEVSIITRGASPRPINKYLTDSHEGIPWIKIGDVSKNSKYIKQTEQKITQEGAKKSRILKKGDFVMSNSMSYGRPYILDIIGAIHDGWASISNYENTLDSDFLYYYLVSSKVEKYWRNKINSSSVSNLNTNIIKSLPVPIISKEVQKYVSKILDKFDILINDLTKGLPKEIELREKQYEYYREKLLDFSKNN